MPLFIKINVRETRNGNPIRTLRFYNNFSLNLKYNSIASTFSFSFLYDPYDKNMAEIFCVSHLHECIVYYNSSTDQNYQVKETDKILTGFLMVMNFKDFSKPQLTTVSGYSKAGVLNECDNPPNITLETEGLSLENIIKRSISPFNIGIIYERESIAEARKVIATGNGVTKKEEKVTLEKALNKDQIKIDDFSEAGDGDDEEDIGKTAPDSTQNVGSYLSELCKARNIVLTSNADGDLLVTKSNTKGTPLISLDFTNGVDASVYKKIPDVESELNFNGQALHSHITVKQQADENESSNGAQITLRNPLLPVAGVPRYKTHTVGSGSEFTVKRAAKYEMSKEIREAVNLTIIFGKIELNGQLIKPNNILMFRNPKLALYSMQPWFIQSVDISVTDKEEKATLSCVPPFAYDFDADVAKNIFVDMHDNSPLD